MHIEIQVALNFVISYLYNKLPRRRVNIFGEELEKALRDKFQGHWYPEKPFKGSAFRCLKTGDPIDSVLERAARESGVPIADILENLPAELSVWVDPGEVSYRIGEKGSVKILYSENGENHEDSSSADREVNKTFNPEAQCFRPIDAMNSSMNNLSLSPKTSPHTSSSSTSPTYKGSPNPAAAASSFMQRTQAPLTFTTATFAQTKFGSTKLKTSSKRANSSYRMSPTEFSNYIKQRAMQQQLHHSHGPVGSAGSQVNHFGPIGPASPSRSLSPNPLALGLGQNSDPFYFANIGGGIGGMYPPQFSGHRNPFDSHFHPEASGLYGNGVVGPGAGAAGLGKFNGFLEPHGFYGLNNQVAPQLPLALQPQRQHTSSGGGNSVGNLNSSGDSNGGNNHQPNIVSTAISTVSSAAANSGATANSPPATTAVAAASPDSNSSKLIDGLNSFYPNATGPYQHLLVAN